MRRAAASLAAPSRRALRGQCDSVTALSASRALTARCFGTAAPSDAYPDWLTCNAAAVLTGPKELTFRPWALPATPPHGHVRVAMQSVGICGSDVHYFVHGRISDFVVRAPLVLGHEAAGEVVQLGGGVTTMRVGTRVALEPGVPCWQNHLARQGRYNLDPDIVFAATPPHHGTLMQYVDHPVEWCFPLPDGMSSEEGAFCEPLSVGVHAVRRGRVAPGLRVAVLGAGPIGLVTLICARVFGADKVAVTDMAAPKLDIARQYGAHAGVRVSRGDTPAHTAAQLCEALGGQPDVVVDCCGFESTMQTALTACARGGRMVLVGMGAHGNVSLPLTAAAAKEVDIIGSFRYANTYPLCISLMSSKRIDISPLITHRFGWSSEQLQAGFQTALHHERSGAIKVMFQF